MIDLLGDPAPTGAVIVAAPEEMPVNETLELAAKLRSRDTVVDLAAVVVNRVLPELFGRGEEEVFAGARRPHRLARRRRRSSTRPLGTSVRPILDGAQLAVTLRRTRGVHLARLREELPAGTPLLYVPVPVPAQPRRAGHPPGGRAPGRGAGVLMAASRTRRAGSLEQLLAAKEIVIHCGSGGVGKTTTAAAVAAMAAVHHGRQGARAHRRPGQAPGQRPRPRGVRQRRDPRARTRPSSTPAWSPAASCGRRCSTRSSRGTTSCAATPPTRPPATRSSPTRSTRTSPAASSRATTTSRWSGSTRSTRRAAST